MDHSFENLKGKVLRRVIVTCEGAKGERENHITFLCGDGDSYRLYHSQSCCEEVYIEDVCGDWQDLLGTPLLVAEEASVDNHIKSLDGRRHGQDDSTTWTFYKLDTRQGGVTIRWIGTSNGYYSERVHFERIGTDFYSELLPSEEITDGESDYLNQSWQIAGKDSGLRLAASLRGQVALIVNLPAAAAAPDRYRELNELHERFRQRGFSVLGLPDARYRGEGRRWADVEGYDASFPVSRRFHTIDANDNGLPLLAWLSGPWSRFSGPIGASFEMFLIDRNGQLVARFPPEMSPLDGPVLHRIAALIA